MLNGLLHANRILGRTVFDLSDWKVIGEYVYDKEGGRHQAFYSPTRNINLLGIDFRAGERIQVEQSLKFSATEAHRLWKDSGLEEVDRWSAMHDNYSEFYAVYLFAFYTRSSYDGVHESMGGIDQ